MSKEKLLIGSVEKDKNKDLISEFEERNQVPLENVSYNFMSNSSEKNQIREHLYLVNQEKIIDSCSIEGLKDTRMCTISFANLETKLKTRKLISLATDYAFHTLFMEEIFVFASKKDQSMQNSLQILGYEQIEEKGNKILYVKDNVMTKESNEAVKWNL